MTNAPTITLAFLAGLLSFLSPCVLPLVPSYLGVLGGGKNPAVRALGFILGFGLVFVALGATASYLGQLLLPYKLTIGRVGGVLIIVFGLVMLGALNNRFIKLPVLMRDTRSGLAGADRYGAVALGAAFAFGWTPCVGPILGSILSLAASSADLPSGVGLLLTYTAGLALPFLIAALLWNRLSLRGLNRYSPIFEKVGGAILVAVGLLMVSGQFTRLASFFYGVMPEWLKI